MLNCINTVISNQYRLILCRPWRKIPRLPWKKSHKLFWVEKVIKYLTASSGLSGVCSGIPEKIRSRIVSFIALFSLLRFVTRVERVLTVLFSLLFSCWSDSICDWKTDFQVFKVCVSACRLFHCLSQWTSRIWVAFCWIPLSLCPDCRSSHWWR